MRFIAALALVAVMAISPFGCTTKVVEIRQVVVTATPATTPTFTPEQLEYLKGLATAQAQPSKVPPTPPPTQEPLPPPALPREPPPAPPPSPTIQAVELPPKIDGTWRVTFTITKIVGRNVPPPGTVVNRIWWISTGSCNEKNVYTTGCVSIVSSSGNSYEGHYAPYANTPPQLRAWFSRKTPCSDVEDVSANVSRSVEDVAQELTGTYYIQSGDVSGGTPLCPGAVENGDLVAVRIEP